MDIANLIKHPEELNKETLYELRTLLALHPYYQPARLLMLQNLYILHDPTFDEELRRSAVYITNRKALFNMIESVHYQTKHKTEKSKLTQSIAQEKKVQDEETDSRTIELINDFLGAQSSAEEAREKRKPTPADAAIDYVAYLMETRGQQDEEMAPQLKGQNLIDDFLDNNGGRISIPETVQSDVESVEVSDNDENEYFTETLAKIYIRQGRFEKALEIIQRLYLNYPKKSIYFADQIRFLEKLIINNKTINN